MILRYRLSEWPLSNSQEKEFSGFLDFEDWLQSLGAGVRDEDPESLHYWAEAYKALMSGPVPPFRISRARMPGTGAYVEILGRK